jgi:HlyD family secretion protein
MKKKKKRGVLLFATLVVLVLAGFVGYRVWAGGLDSGTDEVQTASVTRGSLASTLSSSGNTRSGQSAIISWQASGQVGEVTLNPGDLVEKDQVLVELDSSTLSSDMIQAKQDLVDAQQALDDLLNSKLLQAQALQALEDAQGVLDSFQQDALEASSQAQLALANAQAALQDAEYNRAKMNYPHSTDELVIEKAETDYLLAKQAYKEALQEYTVLAKKKLTNPERAQALTRLLAARDTMNTRLATYNWYLLNYTELDIAQADAELAVAQANLNKAQVDWDSLKDGTSQAAIALAEATLADAQREWERVKEGPSEDDIVAAQAAVDIAQAKLDHARLLAPFDGTITEVNVNTGDLVDSGDAAFRIDDLKSLYIDLQISEVDLPSLQVGQPAAIEFDAIAEKEYSGEVTEIGMIGTVSQGVVNYPVTVKITDVDNAVRPGMTAAVSIILARQDDTLLVPNRAIRNSAGQQSVTVLFEGQQISLPVTVGLVGDTLSEVISDQLREGDVVVINGTTANTSTNDQFTGQFQREFGGVEIINGGPPSGIP